MFDREIAEHEAAHAVAARSFGVKVHELRADGPTRGVAGFCLTQTEEWFPSGRWGGMLIERLATSVAAEVWFARLRRKEFPRPVGFGGDRQNFAEILSEPGFDQLHRIDLADRARRKALEVLTERRDDVMALADRLVRHGAWSLERGWHTPQRAVAASLRAAPRSYAVEDRPSGHPLSRPAERRRADVLGARRG